MGVKSFKKLYYLPFYAEKFAAVPNKRWSQVTIPHLCRTCRGSSGRVLVFTGCTKKTVKPQF